MSKRNEDSNLLARRSLKALLNDEKVPAKVRVALADEYAEVDALLQKLEQNEIHIAVFGRVSVGKSSLLNALMGEQVFSVSALHGETKQREQKKWNKLPTQRYSRNQEIEEHQSGGIHFIDTPGIDEVDGKERELIAKKAAARADIILFVVDSDITQTEYQALQFLTSFTQPIIFVFNKIDLYSQEELQRLLNHIKSRVSKWVPDERFVSLCSEAKRKTIIMQQKDGSETEAVKTILPDVTELKELIWHIVEKDGRTLAALNASMLASDLSDDVGRQVLAARRDISKKIITNYSLAKAMAVAANPVPVADLVAAAGLDASLVIHLSRLHGLEMNKREAGDLVGVIVTQLAALMGASWAVHALSSVLKAGTAGLSTFFTAAAQGSIAYYATIVLGRVTEAWLAQGKSWGSRGPKAVVKEIVDSLDKNSILQEGREAILEKLGRS